MESQAGKSGERALRGGNTPNQDGDEESEYRDCTETHKHQETKAASYRVAEEPPRRSFQIPRRNKEKRALFQYLPCESREFADILNIITSSYKDPASEGNFVYSKPRLIHNELLEKEFIEKRKELKQDGRAEKELAESYCFLLSDNNRVPLLCEKGLSVGSGWLNNLGNLSKGVYLCQFSDLLQVSAFELGSTGEIIIFKVIKGKVKSIHDNTTKSLDPTPKFDSHFSKNANKVTTLQSFKAFEFTQQYFYEYVDFELASRPRHVCPYAVVSFQFKGREATALGPKPLPLQRCNSLPSGIRRERSGYTVWKGQFVNEGKEMYQASLQSLTRPFLPFKLPDRIEISKVMRLDQVKEVVPAALFSWDLYFGNHEVFSSGMHCSLFEVVEKNKSGESLAELFHKLEEKELVFVNVLQDRGFLFLLSSGQMSISSERRIGCKNSSPQALFLYSHPRDVSKSTARPSTDRMSLMPVAEEPVMSVLNSFVPALHYALSKVRSNPLPNLAVGVEQQAQEYLSTFHDSQLIHRIRVNYDQKLDDKEKLFSSPRQRFNWESFVRPYIYNPSQFAMPVEKAKNMMEVLRCVPESSTDPERAGSYLSDPEILFKLVQMNKNLMEAKEHEMGLEEVALAAHGLKRKLEGGVSEISTKCMKLDHGDDGESKAEELMGHQSLVDVLSSIGLQDTDLRKDQTQDVLKVVQILDRLSKSSQDTDLRKDKAQDMLVTKMLDDLNRTLLGAAVIGTDEAEPVNSTQDCDMTLQDSMTKLGLPANCDTDFRNRFVDDEQEDAQGKADLEEETAGSLSSLEAFSPCSDTNGQRGSNVPGDRTIPWVLIPITGLKTERYSHRRDTSLDDPRFLQSPTVSTHTNPEKKDEAAPDQPDSSNLEPESKPETMEDNVTITEDPKVSGCSEKTVPDGPDVSLFNGVDSIVNNQVSVFSSAVEELLKEERVLYTPYSIQAQKNPTQNIILPFSEYVSHFYTPLPVHAYIDLFRDSLCAFVDPQQNIWDSSVVPSSAPSDVAVPTSLHAGAPLQSPSTVQPAFTSNSLTSSSNSAASSASLLQAEQQQTNLPALEPSNLVKQTSSPDGKAEQSKALQDSRGSHASLNNHTVETQSWLAADETAANSRMANEDVTEPPPANISSLISQLQPEMISNLEKIIRDVQKNTSHFYVHCVDEKSDVCWEIKEYLTRLGNPESEPRTFLEKRDSQDRLLIVIQNIDIAAHVHKIPALVSLKKLPSVSFAGVDNLDDIKSHTYNELFVSGGFIVSDEFVLNPDFISQERLQALLQYLEELNTPESPWRWWVHCKTHKKVKELSRSKAEASNVLNLLTTYHKKQIVEFLSYHDCDAPLHQAPDLDCLIKLQAQNIRQRHVIFLTERRFEMFPHYSSSGIVIANIDDILYSMASLIGEACDKPSVSDMPVGPMSPTLREADPVQSSDVHTSDMTSCSSEDQLFEGTDDQPGLPRDAESSLSEHAVGDDVNMASLPSPTSELPKDLDFEALKAAISHFRVARMQASASSSAQSSPRPFTLNPNPLFLSQGDGAASVAQCRSDDDELSSNSAQSFPGRQGAGGEMQHLAVNLSTGGVQTYGRHPDSATTSDTSEPQEACLETDEIMGGIDHCPIRPATSGTNFVVPETTDFSTDRPPWKRTPENPASPKTFDTESDIVQEEKAAEDHATKSLTISSIRPEENENPTSRDGLLPAPRPVAYSVNNTLVGMDRMMLQRNSLWAASQGSMGLNSHGLASQNGAFGHRSVSSSLGMVTHSGLRGFLPTNNIRMPWNGLAQQAAPSMWAIQQGFGLGQVHRTQFIQNYAWHGNPAFPGSTYPPHRGSW